MTTSDLGRVLLTIGVVAVVVGAVLVIAGRLGLGHLPGDLRFGRGGVRIYVPLATSLLVSLVATVVLNLLVRK
jgi:Protein of unknown function (DUF2905)